MFNKRDKSIGKKGKKKNTWLLEKFLTRWEKGSNKKRKGKGGGGQQRE